MKQIDHIGIAVHHTEDAIQLYNAILNTEPFHQEILEYQQVKATFYQIGPTKIEILEATSPESSIAKFLTKNKPGIHHMAFLVDDIEKEIERMVAEGFQPLTEKPYPGALGKLVFFFHPRTTGGALIELCQENK